jgi:Mrp family chromosome partitioning ATPase/predicted Fe-Mo cluster-binding NifX family protein
MSEEQGCGSSCSCGTGGGCATDNLDDFMAEVDREESLAKIKHKLIVLSGKGGVGKSTVAVNLAVALGLSGKKVGLLDVDIHGPSVPKMLKLEDYRPESNGMKLAPALIGNIKVMSIGFLLNNTDDAIIWRGPMKAGVIKQFVEEVAWGELDYLIVDCPPGTGDEPLSVIQTLGSADGAIVVTTPQDVSLADVRKSIQFCHQLKLPVIGVIENMSGFVCPHCGETADIFKSGGGETMADDMSVPFLGRIPLEAHVVEAGDNGTPYVYAYSKTIAAKSFEAIVARIESLVAPIVKETINMLIALPTTDDLLCMHFGHCEKFSIFEVNAEEKKIIAKTVLIPPPHEPGLLPKWLHGEGVDLIIAGGMGQRAQDLFAQSGVKVVVGAQPRDPDSVVMEYLNGTLTTGDNVCDH